MRRPRPPCTAMPQWPLFKRSTFAVTGPPPTRLTAGPSPLQGHSRFVPGRSVLRLLLTGITLLGPGPPRRLKDTVGKRYVLVRGDLVATRGRRPDRPGNEFPGSSIGMSLRDSSPIADATSVLRPHNVPVPVGDIPKVEPGNSFPGRPRRGAFIGNPDQ